MKFKQINCSKPSSLPLKCCRTGNESINIIFYLRQCLPTSFSCPGCAQTHSPPVAACWSARILGVCPAVWLERAVQKERLLCTPASTPASPSYQLQSFCCTAMCLEGHSASVLSWQTPWTVSRSVSSQTCSWRSVVRGWQASCSLLPSQLCPYRLSL